MPKVPSRRSCATESARIRLSDSQNFITDPALVTRLLSHVELDGADTIVEIGPGKGALTAALQQLAPRVLAVEADPGLTLALIQRFAACRRITIAHGDFLDFPLPAQQFVVVANIPFNHTAAIVHKLTGEQSGLRAAYLIMQSEAAHKFSGQPPCPSPLLSHLLRVEFAVEIICELPCECFSPRPSVDAAFVRFWKRTHPLLQQSESQQFKDLLCYLFPRGPQLPKALKYVFSNLQLQRLLHNLSLNHGLKLGALSFDQWLAIHRVFCDHASPAAHRRIQGAQSKLAIDQMRLQKRHRTSNSPREK